MRALTAGAVAAGLLLLPSTPAHAADPTFGTPTREMLARSVDRYTVGDSITVYSIGDSVQVLESEKQEGTQTSVTLGSDVLFAFGRADLSPQAAKKVDALAARLPATGVVTVDGHTDAVGSAADNLVLSRRRAQAVADRLKRTKPGITLKVTGYGETRPVADNGSPSADDPAGRAKNRRVEIRFGRG